MNLLSIKECNLAIEAWTSYKSQYSFIEKCIDPKSIYYFTKEDFEWVKKENEEKFFYIFAGIHNDRLIFIVSPTDISGKVKSLSSYLYLEPSLLMDDLKLVEKTNVEKITTLTSNYTLSNITRETINLLYEDDPTINEDKALVRIKWWLEQAMDWFYCECNEFGSKRIFNMFKVPLFDLNINETTDKIFCMFGFKKTFIYNMMVPVINFIAVDKSNLQQQLVLPDSLNSKSNISDFSSPCPPFCRENAVFPRVREDL